MKPVEAAGLVNKMFEKVMPVFPIGGVILGLLWPLVFIEFRPFVPLFFALMTLSGSLRLRVRDLRAAKFLPRAILLFFVCSRLVMPVIVMVLSRLIFPGDADLVLGFVFLYSIPTAVTGFIWVTVFKGNIVLGLALILADTVFAPFFVPATLQILLGAAVDIDMAGMVLALFLMIVLPTVFGVFLNEASGGKIPDLAGPYLAPLSKLCIIMIVSSNAAAVGEQLNFGDLYIWAILAAGVGFSILAFICGKLIGMAGKLDADKQTSFFITAGLRNSNAAMTLGVEFLPMAAVLPALLGIMTQHVLAAFMGRLLRKKPQAVSQ